MDAVGFVVRALGAQGVAELERVATALYVTRGSEAEANAEQRARRLHELKPHVTLAQALEAVHELDRIAQQATFAEQT
jgi:hypothetical protein